MPKKLALFVVGLMLAVGAFLLYQYFSGTHAGTVTPVKGPPATSTVTTLPAAYEQRDVNGRLDYLIRADKSPEPILDPVTKQPLPGQYTMSNPEATFYHVGDRVVRIMADSCKVVFDQPPRMGPGEKGKIKDQVNLRMGELKGNVRIYISGQSLVNPDAPADKDPFPHGVRMYLDGPVQYDRTQAQLITNDGVHIRSEAADFDGKGLKLAINQQAKRIDFLRIEEGKEIVIRKTELIPTLAPSTTAAATSGPALASAPAPKNGKTAVTYRLTLLRDIVAVQGTQSLAAQVLNVDFTPKGENDAGKETTTAPATNPAVAVSPDAPVIPDMPLTPEPMAAAGPNDVHIQLAGPMELQPRNQPGANLAAREVILEALGSAEKPVLISNSDINAKSIGNAKAGRLLYHRLDNEAQVDLEPGDFKHVLMGNADGMVDCPGATISLQKEFPKLMVFQGPGTAVMPGKGPQDETNVAWKRKMTVDLETITDAKDSKKRFAPRRVVMDGVVIKSPEMDLASETLEAMLFNGAADKKPTLEHLLAKGHVAITSFDKIDHKEDGALQSDTMEILTALNAGKPVPSQLIATGNVSGSKSGKGDDPLALVMPAATGPKPAGPVAPDTIHASRLVADLQPKVKTETQPAATQAREDAIAGMGGAVEVTRLVAQDVRVDVSMPDASRVVAVAAALDAKPLDKTATLIAADGVATPVRIGMGDQKIEARRVDVNQKAGTFMAPGQGVFNFIRPADPRKKDDKPTPMQVSWEKAMSFSQKDHVAIFQGSPIAQIPGEQSNLGWLRSDDSLTVNLVPDLNALKPNGSKVSPIKSIVAVGNVQAAGAKIEDGKKVGDVRFSAIDSPGKKGELHYFEASQSFEIPGPGALVVNIDMTPKPGAKSDETAKANGQHVFGWKESLVYQMDSGSSDGTGLVTFKRDVDYVFIPKNGFKVSQAKPKETTRDRADLHTDLLTAKVRQATGKSVDSAIGMQDFEVVSVNASSGAHMETHMDDAFYRIDGGSLSFNPATHQALILPNSVEGDRVVVERVGTEQRGTALRVLMDLSNNQKMFTVDSPRGNLAGFGN